MVISVAEGMHFKNLRINLRWELNCLMYIIPWSNKYE